MHFRNYMQSSRPYFFVDFDLTRATSVIATFLKPSNNTLNSHLEDFIHLSDEIHFSTNLFCFPPVPSPRVSPVWPVLQTGGGRCRKAGAAVLQRAAVSSVASTSHGGRLALTPPA